MFDEMQTKLASERAELGKKAAETTAIVKSTEEPTEYWEIMTQVMDEAILPSLADWQDELVEAKPKAPLQPLKRVHRQYRLLIVHPSLMDIRAIIIRKRSLKLFWQAVVWIRDAIVAIIQFFINLLIAFGKLIYATVKATLCVFLRPVLSLLRNFGFQSSICD